VADELATHLQKDGHSIIEVKIPKNLYFGGTLIKVFLLIIYQQFVCPIVAIRHRAELVVDPYNGFSIIGSFFVKTKYFIHDYTPFKRKYWFFRPGTIYQFLMFKIDSWFSLAEMYHDALNIDTPKYLKRASAPRVFPCIVDSLDRSSSTFFKNNVQPILDACNEEVLVISTISGSGWNKDFPGLLNNLKRINRRFVLIAFGFGDSKDKHEKIIMDNGVFSDVLSIGFVDEASISDTIFNSDLFVFHSLSEGFGRPIVEALQLVKIVVTTVNAPILTILSNDALENIFKYKDASEFLIAIDGGSKSAFNQFENIYKPEIDQSIQQFLS
jgi:hypothetical protein